MPRLSKPQLLSTIVSSISRSGWKFLYISDQHPFLIQVYRGDESFRIKVYVWNLTHGGGTARPVDEYRIQITGVESIETEVGGKTLVLGWWDRESIFAAFDLSYHSGAVAASPSIQIKEESLREAHRNGLSAYEKGNEELAIAFRPEFFVDYIRQMEYLHALGVSQEDLDTLRKVIQSPEDVDEVDLSAETEERRSVLTTVMRRLRLSSFRSRVLAAYGYSCAFCGLQLELVQAAHILPVSHADSTDETANGMAACHLHHAAYDSAVITFDGEYSVLTNDEALEQLAQLDRAGGIDQFMGALKRVISVPSTEVDRPRLEFVQHANALRGWPV